MVFENGWLAVHIRILLTKQLKIVCAFTRDGIINTQNLHLWHEENPHAFTQQQFSLNVWSPICDFYIGLFLPRLASILEKTCWKMFD